MINAFKTQTRNERSQHERNAHAKKREVDEEKKNVSRVNDLNFVPFYFALPRSSFIT